MKEFFDQYNINILFVLSCIFPIIGTFIILKYVVKWKQKLREYTSYQHKKLTFYGSVLSTLAFAFSFLPYNPWTLASASFFSAVITACAYYCYLMKVIKAEDKNEIGI